MRHSRARRRFRFVLTILLFICVIMFIESRIEALIPQIKNFAEAKIEDMFNKKIKLSIGSIDGGLVRPFVLSGISIKGAKGAPLFSSVDINSIRTNYRIWDVFLKQGNNTIVSNFLSRDSSIYINFVTKKENISGFVKFDGDLTNSKVKGYVNLLDGKKLDFSGAVKGDSFDLDIGIGPSAVRAVGNMSDEGNLTVNIKVNHIKLYNFDIACEAILKNRIVNVPGSAKGSYVEGEFEASDVVLNYKPFLNIRASYKIADGILNISSLDLGDSFKVIGKAAIRRPYNVDMTLTANNVNLSWLLASIGAKDATSVISGTMSGKFEFKGPVNNPKLNAHMEIKKGTLATLDFEYLSANLKGDGPFVRIEESRITRESGYFMLGGEIDFSKIGKDSMFDKIKLTSNENAIDWDGLGSVRTRNIEEITMKKKLTDDLNLDFKQFVTEEKVGEGRKSSDEVQLEYKLQPNDSLKVAVGQDKNFMGFEHKDKF